MAEIEILLRLPAGLAQDEVVERLSAEGMTDCACGLGLPGHVEAEIVRVSMPAIGLDCRLPE